MTCSVFENTKLNNYASYIIVFMKNTSTPDILFKITIYVIYKKFVDILYV